MAGTDQTYASFSGPDGNGWLLHEVKTRLPGLERQGSLWQTQDQASLPASAPESQPALE